MWSSAGAEAVADVWTRNKTGIQRWSWDCCGGRWLSSIKWRAPPPMKKKKRSGGLDGWLVVTRTGWRLEETIGIWSLDGWKPRGKLRVSWMKKKVRTVIEMVMLNRSHARPVLKVFITRNDKCGRKCPVQSSYDSLRWVILLFVPLYIFQQTAQK